jgi:L-malate glycosyltransferase
MREGLDGSERAPLSVCHLASGDLWAGAEVQIATLMRFLANDKRLSLSAVILNRGRLADEIARCGIAVCVVPESEMSLTAIIQRASEFMANRKVEIIHSHRYKENLVAARAAKQLGISHIVRTQHGMPEPQTGVRAIKRGMINLIDRAVARRATSRVISVSNEMSSQLAKVFETNKIVTIPNGIDASAVASRFSTAEAKERLGLPADALVIGTAGRLETVKRLDVFLRTAAVISSDQRAAFGQDFQVSSSQPSASSQAKNSDLKQRETTQAGASREPSTGGPLRARAPAKVVRFVIAGEGREAASLARFARKLDLVQQVHFLGHRDDVYDVLRAFDVMMLTSDHEGLPMVLLEAMALGVPVVLRAVGGIPEVVTHGENGLLIPTDDPRSLADACTSILTDRALSERLAEGGRKTVRGKFSAAANAARVAELYLALCGRS